jgi:hypothetical protein
VSEYEVFGLRWNFFFNVEVTFKFDRQKNEGRDNRGEMADCGFGRVGVEGMKWKKNDKRTNM